jgi:protein arginine N-methyltransferase 2
MCNNHPNAETGLKVLNVGFGLGIVGVTRAAICIRCGSSEIYTQIDSYFQALPVPPSTHVIIEPHPDVLRHMREQGWYDKKGVTVLEGKWQDFVGTKMFEDMAFDAVYTDTFSEDYGGEAPPPCRGTFNSASRFVSIFRPCSKPPRRSRRPIQLLQRSGSDQYVFPYSHDMALTVALLDASFYDVYTHLAELHLATVGIDVEWAEIDVATQEAVRWGETQGYFSMRLYRLPIGRIIQS